MKELLFDTSVYGELVDDDEALITFSRQVNKFFLVFGSSTVRDELERTPAVTLVSRGKFKGLNLRELLLWLYRLFVEESGGEVKDSDLVEVLALRYKMESKKAVSSQAMNDFRIVAAASLQGIGVFVSADKRQISAEERALYLGVNAHYQLATPLLVAYADFKVSPGKYADSLEGEGNRDG